VLIAEPVLFIGKGMKKPREAIKDPAHDHFP
jgi:hypothetical protein